MFYPYRCRSPPRTSHDVTQTRTPLARSCSVSLRFETYTAYVSVTVCFHDLPLTLHLHLEMCPNVHVFWVHTCARVSVCVYNCVGSQRLSEPEFDEGTAVVPKGGWGSFLCLPQTGLLFELLF